MVNIDKELYRKHCKIKRLYEVCCYKIHLKKLVKIEVDVVRTSRTLNAVEASKRGGFVLRLLDTSFRPPSKLRRILPTDLPFRRSRFGRFHFIESMLNPLGTASFHATQSILTLDILFPDIIHAASVDRTYLALQIMAVCLLDGELYTQLRCAKPTWRF